LNGYQATVKRHATVERSFLLFYLNDFSLIWLEFKELSVGVYEWFEWDQLTVGIHAWLECNQLTVGVQEWI
jgi:hypothetical protein